MKFLLSVFLFVLLFAAGCSSIYTVENQNNSSAEGERLYKLGRDAKAVKNYSEAVNYYKKASMLGHRESQNNLGAFYQSGDGVQQDYKKALYWYLKSANQKSDYGFIAKNNAGSMYLNGYGVEKNYTEAYRWIKKSADQNFSLAQNNLGYMYLHGLGVEKNISTAKFWFRKAANQGYITAKRNLGYIERMERKASQRGIPQ